MSFKAELKIDGRKINLLYADYDFQQRLNKDGFPGKLPQSGFVTVVVESQADTFFLDWVLSSSQKKSGSLFFYKRDNMSKMKELIFTDAYCVGFREKFNSLGEHPLFIEVKLTAGELRYGDSAYKNPWFESEGAGGGNDGFTEMEKREEEKPVTKREKKVEAPLVLREEANSNELLNDEILDDNKILGKDKVGLSNIIDNRIPNSGSSSLLTPQSPNQTISIFDTQEMDEDHKGEDTSDEEWGTLVKYLSDEERAKLEIFIIDGLVHDVNGSVYDTADSKTAWKNSEGRAIYVMDPNGNIYISKYQARGLFHHSSILGGKPVASAGEIVIKDGVIEEISNKSGHYKPSKELNQQVISELGRKGADLQNLKTSFI